MSLFNKVIIPKLCALSPFIVLWASNLLAALLLLMGIGSLKDVKRVEVSHAAIMWIVFLAIGLLAAWFSGALSITLKEWGKIVIIVGCAWVAMSNVNDSNKHIKMLNYHVSWLVAVVIFAVDMMSSSSSLDALLGHDINFFNKGACAIAVGGWLWLYTVSCRYSNIWSILGYLAISLLIYSMESEAAMLGLICSSFVFVITKRWPNLYNLLAGSIGMGFMITPILVYLYMGRYLEFIPDDLPHSWDHRIHIACNTMFLILEKPVLGWGIGISKVLHAMDQGHVVMMEADGGEHSIFNYHPHNTALQVLLETGIIGLLLYSFAWVATIRFIGKSLHIPELIKPYIYATCSAYIMIGFLNFNTWASWWLSLIMLQGVVIAMLNNSAYYSKSG